MKYFMPKSLTWWVAMAPLIAGIIVATEPIHGQAALVQSILNGSDMTAPEMILTGLGGIGLRRAVG